MSHLLFSHLCFSVGGSSVFAVTAESDLSRRPVSLAVRREADETVWRHTATGTEYVEFASGLNYQTTEGEWRPSREEIVLLQDGSAGALQGQHKAIFAPNLNSAGSIHLVSRDDRPFRSHPLGLYYFCAITGRSALVAQVQDSIGELLPPNQIVYRDAFGGLPAAEDSTVHADVRFTYTKTGIETDVIIRSLPPPEAFGLASQSTRLEVWWGFVDAPDPERQVRVLKAEETGRESMVEPDLIDETLDFGDLWFPQGKAFSVQTTSPKDSGEAARIDLPELFDDESSIYVGKQWLQLDEQTVLVESVDWKDAEVHLERVMPAATFAGVDLSNRVRPTRVLDFRVPSRKAGEVIHLAKANYRESGLVIDYISVNPSGCVQFPERADIYISSSGIWVEQPPLAPAALSSSRPMLIC